MAPKTNICGGRRIRGDEDVEALAEPLALRPVVEEAGGPGGEHADDVLAHGVVEALGAEAALGVVGPDDQMPPDEVRAADDGGDRDRFLGGDAARDAVELRPRLVVDALDEHLEDPAAGQADGEGVVVADPVGLVAREPVGEDLLAELVQRTLDAAAADRADRLAGVAHEHGRPGRTRR